MVVLLLVLVWHWNTRSISAPALLMRIIVAMLVSSCSIMVIRHSPSLVVIELPNCCWKKSLHPKWSKSMNLILLNETPMDSVRLVYHHHHHLNKKSFSVFNLKESLCSISPLNSNFSFQIFNKQKHCYDRHLLPWISMTWNCFDFVSHFPLNQFEI